MGYPDVCELLKQVEGWCRAAAVALAYYRNQCEAQMVTPPLSLRIADLRECQDELELTHIVRLFSAFEVSLRSYWDQGLHKKTIPNVVDLINSIAARHKMATDVRDNAHHVREYRNALVHQGGAPALTLSDCRGYLCTYASYLPRKW